MTGDDASDDVVTVIRLVSLGRADHGHASSVVTAVGLASIRTDGDSYFLVTRDASVRQHLKVGDVVYHAADRFGIVWRAEQRAEAAG